METGFTILRYEDFGVIRSFQNVDGSSTYSLTPPGCEENQADLKSSGKLRKTSLGLNSSVQSKADCVSEALAMAMGGATLVAAWRDGGAAKRTRL